MQEESRFIKPTLESLVERAEGGNRESLEEIVRRIQDRIYRLALRMLYHPTDAEEATREILIRIITRLDRYQGRSRFTTWASKVASNHLLHTRQRRVEKLNLSFESFHQEVDMVRSVSRPGHLDKAETRLLAKEEKYQLE